MSWIFFMLLVGYGLIRVCLRVRGNYRYLKARRDELPARSKSAQPEHLGEGLGRLFAAGEEVACALDTRRRIIAMVLVVDPDAGFGEIRDGRFRLHVLEAMPFVGHWLDAHGALTEAEHLRAEALGITPDTMLAVRDRLRPIVRRVSRARALEPFAVSDVREVHDALLQMVGLLDDFRDRLRDGAAHPYRGPEGAPVPQRFLPANFVTSRDGSDQSICAPG